MQSNLFIKSSSVLIFVLVPFYTANAFVFQNDWEVTNHCISQFYKEAIMSEMSEKKIILDLSKTTFEIEFCIIIIKQSKTFMKHFIFLQIEPWRRQHILCLPLYTFHFNREIQFVSNSVSGVRWSSDWQIWQ